LVWRRELHELQFADVTAWILEILMFIGTCLECTLLCCADVCLVLGTNTDRRNASCHLDFKNPVILQSIKKLFVLLYPVILTHSPCSAVKLAFIIKSW
jgi:hypothetical protein